MNGWMPRPTPTQKEVLSRLSPDQVTAVTLAGEPILAKLTRAPGNDAAIGGLKVVTENGWFAARPSGTEDIYKIYTESFKGPEHLAQIQTEAQEIVRQGLSSGGGLNAKVRFGNLSRWKSKTAPGPGTESSP